MKKAHLISLFIGFSGFLGSNLLMAQESWQSQLVTQDKTGNLTYQMCIRDRAYYKELVSRKREDNRVTMIMDTFAISYFITPCLLYTSRCV